MQRLRQGPLLNLLPGDWELWLDGGHNADAGQAIAAILGDWRKSGDLGTSLIFGMLNSKDPVAFLSPLAPLVEDLSAVSIPGDHAALPAEECVRAAERVGIAAKSFSSPIAAIQDILDRHRGKPRHRVLICGSLYLAGSILSENG